MYTLPSSSVKADCLMLMCSAPWMNRAPPRCSAQSPPAGIPHSSKYVYWESRKPRPWIVTPFRGLAMVLVRLSSVLRVGTTHPSDGGAPVPLCT